MSLQEIDARLTRDLDDWQVLLGLHHHREPWDGLITTDDGMLNLPRELAVLMQTKLTLVVAQGSGHDPVKATGLVLAHLPWICQRTRPDQAQIWRLSTRPAPHLDPWHALTRVADHRNEAAADLYAANRLSEVGLARDPLA